MIINDNFKFPFQHFLGCDNTLLLRHYLNLYLVDLSSAREPRISCAVVISKRPVQGRLALLPLCELVHSEVFGMVMLLHTASHLHLFAQALALSYPPSHALSLSFPLFPSLSLSFPLLIYLSSLSLTYTSLLY